MESTRILGPGDPFPIPPGQPAAESWGELDGRALRAPEPAGVKHVCAIQLYFVGDSLLATPAIRALRRRYPNALLEMVVKRRCRGIFAGSPQVDRVTVYDPEHFWQRPWHFRSLERAWREQPVDVAVDFTADRRSAMLLDRMHPACAVGFLRGNLELRVQAGIPKSCGPAHVAEHMLRLTSLLGAEGSPELEYHPGAAARERARTWRSGLSGPAVALHPGCNSLLRRWKPERWAELVRRLRACGLHPWALGGPGESKLGPLLERAGAEITIGRLSLEDTAARLEVSAAMVGNDSGPMHLSVSVGTPTLVLFGPSLPHTVAPPGPAHAWLHVPMPCWPCDQRRCVQPGNFCLDAIPVDRVLMEVRRMIGPIPGDGGGA